MNKRPVPVVIIGGLLVLIGVTGFVVHLNEMKPQHALEGDHPSILVAELVAIVSGVFLLRGANWARWLAMLWIAFHLAISLFDDSAQRVVVHSVSLVLFAYFLFRPSAHAYFRRT